MAVKAVLVFCAQALLVQSALSQCIGPFNGVLAPALSYDGLALGGGCAAPFVPAASVGGSFVVTSASPVAPTGISIVSENLYEGSLILGGNLPLLGSVGVEGELATAGAGAVSYGCGDDAVAIVNEEGPIATGIVAPIFAAGFPGYAFPGFAAAPFGYGFGYGLGYGRGYGLGYGPGLFGLGYGASYGPSCGCGFY